MIYLPIVNQLCEPNRTSRKQPAAPLVVPTVTAAVSRQAVIAAGRKPLILLGIRLLFRSMVQPGDGTIAVGTSGYGLVKKQASKTRNPRIALQQ